MWETTMLRDYLRSMTVAPLALSVLAVPSLNLHGKNQHPDDDGVRCVYYDHDGVMRFYLPGQTLQVTDGNGHHVTLECGEDGNWTMTKSTQQSGNGQTS